MLGTSNGFATWFFDYDNDGRDDLFATSYAPSLDEMVRGYLGLPINATTMRLYHNVGDGSFRDVSTEAGLARAHAHGRQLRRSATTVSTCAVQQPFLRRSRRQRAPPQHRRARLRRAISLLGNWQSCTAATALPLQIWTATATRISCSRSAA